MEIVFSNSSCDPTHWVCWSMHGHDCPEVLQQRARVLCPSWRCCGGDLVFHPYCRFFHWGREGVAEIQAGAERLFVSSIQTRNCSRFWARYCLSCVVWLLCPWNVVWIRKGHCRRIHRRSSAHCLLLYFGRCVFPRSNITKLYYLFPGLCRREKLI